MTKVLVLAVSLVVVPVASSQKDYSVCAQMVSDAAHNVGVTTTSYDYSDSIFEQNCEQDGSIKSSHLDLSVVVKAIPIQFAAGSDEQTVRNFCKTFSQDVRLRTASYHYNSQVVDSSLKTAAQCVDIITKGSTIVHRFLGADTLRLSVTAPSGGAVEIKGLQPGKDTKCVSPGKLLSINWDINTNHTVSANDGTYTIVCTRAGTPRPDLGPGVQFFNRTNIVMGTNVGGYDVFWPDQHVEPERDAEKLAENIASLQKQISDLKARVDGIGGGGNEAYHTFLEGARRRSPIRVRRGISFRRLARLLGTPIITMLVLMIWGFIVAKPSLEFRLHRDSRSFQRGIWAQPKSRFGLLRKSDDLFDRRVGRDLFGLFFNGDQGRIIYKSSRSMFGSFLSRNGDNRAHH